MAGLVTLQSSLRTADPTTQHTRHPVHPRWSSFSPTQRSASAAFLSAGLLSEEADIAKVGAPRYRIRASGQPMESLQNIENLYSPSKHGRQQTISNTNEIKQL